MFDPVARIRKVKSRNCSKLKAGEETRVVVGEEHLRGDDRAGEVLEEHAEGPR